MTKKTKQYMPASAPQSLSVRNAKNQSDGTARYTPPGWIGGPPPQTLGELADYLAGKLQAFRGIPQRDKGYYHQRVLRGSAFTLRQQEANAEHVQSRLLYASFTSSNVVRWLDGKELFAGRPPGVAVNDGIRHAEDKLSALLQWVRERLDSSESVGANSRKFFPKGRPSNPDLVDLALQLNCERDSGKSMIQIARKFTGETEGNDHRAQSLLSQIRRLRRQGRLNL